MAAVDVCALARPGSTDSAEAVSFLASRWEGELVRGRNAALHQLAIVVPAHVHQEVVRELGLRPGRSHGLDCGLRRARCAALALEEVPFSEPIARDQVVAREEAKGAR